MRQEGRIIKEHEETFRGDAYVYYLDLVMVSLVCKYVITLNYILISLCSTPQ